MTALTGQAQAALEALHTRARHTTDNFQLEQIDRALDELLRLNSNQPTAFQLRSAMSHAAKVLRDRRRVAPVISLDDPQFRLGELGALDPEAEAIEVHCWLRTTHQLTEAERRVLALMAAYDDAHSVAAKYGVPPARIRERTARARRAARSAYVREVMTAA